MEQSFIPFAPDYKFLGTDTSAKIGYIEGYGAIFGNVDEVGDIIAPGAFAASLKADGMPVMLKQHNPDDVIGTWTSANEDEKGLFLKGELNLDVQKGVETYSLLKKKAFKGLSIGYKTQDFSVDQKTGVRTLKKVKLYEVSLVTFPANLKAGVSGVKGLPETEREFEAVLRDMGFGKGQAKAIISGGFPAYKAMRRDADEAAEAELVRRDADYTEGLQTLNDFFTQLKGLKS